MLRVESNKNMDVIGHAIDGDQLVPLLLNDTRHVAVQILFPLGPNETMPVLDRKDGLNIDLGIGIGHATSVLSY